MKTKRLMILLVATGIVQAMITGLSQSGLANNSVVQTGIVDFICETDQHGETLFAYTRKTSIPILRWVAVSFQGVQKIPRKRCRNIAVKFQRFYNCGILNNIIVGSESASDLVVGNVTRQSAFVKLNESEISNLRKLCPILKPNNYKLVLFEFGKDVDSELLENKLNDISVGIYEKPVVCNSCQ